MFFLPYAVGALAERRTHASRPVPVKHANPSLRSHRSALRANNVSYTRSWFGLGVASALVGTFWLRRYGRPAVASMGAASLASLAYMTLYEPTNPRLERLTLRFPRLPAALDGLRIGQITDSHLGLAHTAENLAWAVQQMRQERPDLIVITGDVVGARRALPDVPLLLQGLAAPLGVYAVPGNHDYWEGVADLDAALARLGIPLLLNEHRRLEWNGGELWLLGLDDLWDGRPDLSAALQGVPRQGFKVLLSHAPDIADEAAARAIDLQLSGHTHGGHLRLPLLGPFSLPRFGVCYAMGRYKVGTMTLYVSRGLGGMPMRLMCRPEATIVTLRRGV